MICNPLFLSKDIELEKQVVFEEIGSVHDAPEEYIFDLFQEKIYPDQPMGYPILGDRQSVNSFKKSEIKKFWRNYYCPSNIVLAVAGNVDHQQLTDLAEKYFSFSTSTIAPVMKKAKAARHINFNYREAVNQSHICLGNEAVSYYHQNRYDFMALSSYLGGGLSSRLFQVLREELGYVYSVYSFLDFYKDTGILGFYLGTDLRNTNKAIKRLFQELNSLSEQELSSDTVVLLKEQLKGRFFLSLESTFKRMMRIAKNEIYFNRYIDDNEIVQSIDKICAESLHEISCKFLNPEDFSQVTIKPGRN
jgi:predicted Zn-dependent peptidase